MLSIERSCWWPPLWMKRKRNEWTNLWLSYVAIQQFRFVSGSSPAKTFTLALCFLLLWVSKLLLTFTDVVVRKLWLSYVAIQQFRFVSGSSPAKTFTLALCFFKEIINRVICKFKTHIILIFFKISVFKI